MNANEFLEEMQEQVMSYVELCEMYEKTPSVLGFAELLTEAYEVRNG